MAVRTREGDAPRPGGAREEAPDLAHPLHLFLLVGQSNMAGAPAPGDEDRVEHPRVEVLAYADSPGRREGSWYPALPPLHCDGCGVGPGDWFGRTLAVALPNARIGLVPCAIAGVDVDFFRKGVISERRAEFRIPPDDHWSGAYDWVIARARRAQERGTVRGILFSQGESDSGDPAWVDKVAEIIRDLRADLRLGNVPFVAAELLHGGACEAHNALVRELPARIPNAHVVSAEGLAGEDRFHFGLEAQRELGRRFARCWLELGDAARR